ncbi:ProQ/FINO family protein [Halomonas sp.]|uniref:ProQ/FINO family protein n=1 Tax=Halomonas sp. TaxID=1486246 RepID=UPI003D0B8D4C
MAEQRLHSLLDALDGRTRSLLQRLADEREARRHAESVQAELTRRLGELEQRLAEAEASRLELAEENRELDEQNRELEAHNRHLHERLTGGERAEEGGFRPGRHSQGLSALLGRRPASTTPASEAPVGARFIGDIGDNSAAAGPDAGSSDTASPESDRAGGDQATAADVDTSPEPNGAHQDSLAIGEAPSPQALLDEWYARYPAAFFKGHTRPLMVGIHEVLASREPWPEKLVRRALACYVNLPRYLKAVRDGAERIDLDGQPAGVVDAQAADHARRKLDRLQGEKGPRQAQPSKSGRGKGKPARAQAGKAAKGSAPSQPAAGQASPQSSEPPSLEEKLSALMAKHNGR